MRFQGTCYRAHDPRWSFKPISGYGAALRGGRFNAKGTPALYLSLTIMTAVKEANQGFARKLDPSVMCSYDVDCDDIADLRTPADQTTHGISAANMACSWLDDAPSGNEPASWTIAAHFVRQGFAGVLVPSFAAGATAEDQNLVLWTWSDRHPHRVSVHDPSGRLPKNALSWD